MIDIQVTLTSSNGRRPIATIIHPKSIEDWNENKARYKREAVQLICAKRHMTWRDLQKYGYDTIMTGDPAKIREEMQRKYAAAEKQE